MSLKKDKQTNPPKKSPTNSSVSMTLREVSQEKSRWLTWNSAFLILITFDGRSQRCWENNWQQWREKMWIINTRPIKPRTEMNDLNNFSSSWSSSPSLPLRRPNLTSGRAPFSHPRHYRPPQAPWPGREESCKTRRGSAARCCVRYARRVEKMIRRFSGWAAISPSSATAGAITEMDERRSGRHRGGWRFRRRGCENAAFSTRNNESVEIRKCCFALTQCHERITLWKIQRKNEPLCPARRVILGLELCFEP